MKIIDIHELQNDFENLVEQAANGEPFILSIEGKPLVQFSAYDPLDSQPSESASAPSPPINDR